MTQQKLEKVRKPTAQEVAEWGTHKDFPTGCKMVALSTIVSGQLPVSLETCSAVVVEHQQRNYLVPTNELVPEGSTIATFDNSTTMVTQPIVNGG